MKGEQIKDWYWRSHRKNNAEESSKLEDKLSVSAGSNFITFTNMDTEQIIDYLLITQYDSRWDYMESSYMKYMLKAKYQK